MPTTEDAAHALWAAGDERGLEPGSFTQTLILAIQRADAGNRHRLWLGFPSLVQAILISRTPEGCDELARIMQEETDRGRKR